jgi:PTS system nitrogen regulatory IIA component
MYLNVIQLAESLGVDESIVDGWVKNEHLPCIRDAGRLLFDRAQVASWAAERGMAVRTGFLAPVQGQAISGTGLKSLLQIGGIWREVQDVPETLTQAIQRLPGASPEILRLLVQRVRSPGAITWAPVGKGIALPHLRSRVALGRDSGLIALLFLAKPLSIDEATPDTAPIDRLLFFVSPTPRAHLELLAKLSGALSRGTFREKIRLGASDADIFQALSNEETLTTQRPGGQG